MNEADQPSTYPEQPGMTVQLEQMERMSEVLKLVADRNRMLTLALLQHGEMCVCELVEILQLSQPTVSQNLRKMKSYGLVKETKKKNWVFYSLQIEDKPYVAELLRHVPDVGPLIEDLNRRGMRVSCDS
ncbi:ArsR/SmtB family transcription factor [Brevibacillus dissolubilis]|uniref:ArsR/SmtB family transcription factor n=1 Tax=Brevibacillus dissolubilis TaxID=1844116 RepID=UPI0021000EE3|nr:metalloregulator ArsR/SmtB family transcription factor [Brevibacillus dissolubilis]